MIPTNGAGTEHVSWILVLFTAQDQSYSQVLSLHILYSSKFYWHTKMFAELQCVISHHLRDVLYTHPRLIAAVTPFLCGNCLWSPSNGIISHTYTAHFKCIPFAWSKSIFFQVQPWQEISFESHAVSAFL